VSDDLSFSGPIDLDSLDDCLLSDRAPDDSVGFSSAAKGTGCVVVQLGQTANDDDQGQRDQERAILRMLPTGQTFWIMVNRNAVVRPNKSIPFNASRAPIICQCPTR
jgi:hypothetical protein